jgi:hypothetical protein
VAFVAAEFDLISAGYDWTWLESNFAGVQNLLGDANRGAEMTTTDPLPDTSMNRVFRAFSLFCAASQGLLFIRHAFTTQDV